MTTFVKEAINYLPYLFNNKQQTFFSILTPESQLKVLNATDELKCPIMFFGKFIYDGKFDIVKKLRPDIAWYYVFDGDDEYPNIIDSYSEMTDEVWQFMIDLYAMRDDKNAFRKLVVEFTVSRIKTLKDLMIQDITRNM
jgi:hypothetical protein